MACLYVRRGGVRSFISAPSKKKRMWSRAGSCPPSPPSCRLMLSLTSQRNFFLRPNIRIWTNHRAVFPKNLSKALRTRKSDLQSCMVSAHVTHCLINVLRALGGIVAAGFFAYIQYTNKLFLTTSCAFLVQRVISECFTSRFLPTFADHNLETASSCSALPP